MTDIEKQINKIKKLTNSVEIHSLLDNILEDTEELEQNLQEARDEIRSLLENDQLDENLDL